jgi:hypothetical protein
MAQLSTAQVKALRAIDKNCAAVDRISDATYNALRREGYLGPNGNLTWKADVWLRNYVEKTGDGPEDLKAMLRF